MARFNAWPGGTQRYHRHLNGSLGRALGEASSEGNSMCLDICHDLRTQTSSGDFLDMRMLNLKVLYMLDC